MSTKLRKETLAQLEAFGNDTFGNDKTRARNRKRGVRDGADNRWAARGGWSGFEV